MCISASSAARDGADCKRRDEPSAAANSRGVIAQKFLGDSRSKPSPARITSSQGKGEAAVSPKGKEVDSTAAIKGLGRNGFLSFRHCRKLLSIALKPCVHNRLHRPLRACQLRLHRSHYVLRHEALRK